jgi:hypothetical protein
MRFGPALALCLGRRENRNEKPRRRDATAARKTKNQAA